MNKDCFGSYEDSNVSWHCKGCIVANECKEYGKLKGDENGEAE